MASPACFRSECQVDEETTVRCLDAPKHPLRRGLPSRLRTEDHHLRHDQARGRDRGAVRIVVGRRPRHHPARGGRVRAAVVCCLDVQLHAVRVPRVPPLPLPLSVLSRRGRLPLGDRERHRPLRAAPARAVRPPQRRGRQERPDGPLVRVGHALVQHFVRLVVREAVVHADPGGDDDDGIREEGPVRRVERDAEGEGVPVAPGGEGHDALRAVAAPQRVTPSRAGPAERVASAE